VAFGVFDFSNYRALLLDRLQAESGGKKRGASSRLAQFLRVHPSRLSRIVQGNDHPTPEQAYLISRYFKFTADEEEYFVNLVNYERASTAAYKQHVSSILDGLRKKATQPAPLNLATRAMTADDERILHSSSKYLAVWLQSMISGRNTLPEIAKRFDLPGNLVERIAGFLVEIGFCQLLEGRLVPGSRSLMLSSDSPQLAQFFKLAQFFTNWRMHAIEQIGARKPDDYFASEPMAIGVNARREITQLLRETLQKAHATLKTETADKVVCLNIDWFEV
jgi:plasmid maintenance system antidote protein VapI